MTLFCSIITIVGLIFVGIIGLLLVPSNTRKEHKQLTCARCSATMYYKIVLPNKIRCSCGNIMPLPKTYQHKVNQVKCPGCTETIHVSPIKKPTRIRCRCGNIANIP